MQNEIIDLNIAPSELTLNQEAFSFLKESSTWGKFIAISSSIINGIILLALLVATDDIQSLTGDDVVVLVFIVLSLLYFIPAFFLFRYSYKLKLAIDSRNNTMLTAAFENHKTMFKVMGLLMILFILLFIAFIIAVINDQI